MHILDRDTSKKSVMLIAEENKCWKIIFHLPNIVIYIYKFDTMSNLNGGTFIYS